MVKRKCTLSCAAFLMVLFIACTGPRQGELTVRGGEPVVYRCGKAGRIVARYYTLSDSSLRFVRLTMPDGKEYTLPNVVSGSGSRYTDDRELVWWIKGDSAFVQTRDANGEWEITIPDCGVVREEKER